MSEKTLAVPALPATHRLAEYLAVAVVVSLPWSTSATSVLVVLWLLAVVPTLEIGELRRVVLTPAGSLPLLVVALAVLGMLWADVPWAERFDGVAAFAKLAVIPLLITQFRRVEDRSFHADSSVVPAFRRLHACDAAETDAHAASHRRFQREMTRNAAPLSQRGQSGHH